MLKILTFLLYASLLVAQVIEQEREAETSHNIVFGSKPSTIPTGGLIHNFQPMSKDLFSNVDISSTPQAHLFAGYGVYDIKDDNCVFIDAKVSDGSSANMKFFNFKIYNGHTYAMSINEMTHAECSATAIKYSGYPVDISTPEENEAIATLYNNYEIWLGTQRAGPCPSEYVDYKGDKVYFNGFENLNEMCSDIEPYVISKKQQNIWEKRDALHTATCVVEFGTEDWKRPLKTCAPWWGVERTYLLPTKSKYLVMTKNKAGELVETDIRDFNQKDFPKVIEMCTQLNLNSTSISDEPISQGTQTVTCNTYYDRTASPRCMESPNQSLCRVDECRGAIRNNCMLIKSGSAPLDYSKDPVFIDGEFTYIKKRTKIEIHEFRCPVLKPTDNCSEVKSITMLPQPCPGTEFDADGNETRPIRVYGDPALPGINKYDTSGTLINLYGECPDGKIVEVPINVLKQNTKVCLEYDTIVNKKEYDQMCIVDRVPSDYTVESSITSGDAFKDDENCIRLNNIEDARPRQDIRVDYKTYGMANLAIVKAQVDGKIETKYETLVPSLYYQRIINNMQYQETSLGLESLSNVTSDDLGLDTSKYPKLDCTQWEIEESNLFYDDLLAYQISGVQTVYDYAGGNIVDLGVITKESCLSKNIAVGTSVLWGADAVDVSATNVLYETAYQFNTLTGESSENLIKTTDASATTGRCMGVVDQAIHQGDVYKRVEIASVGIDTPPDISFITTNFIDYESCREVAICNGMDVLNDNKYIGDQECRLHLTETSGAIALAEYQIELDEEIATQLNVNQTTEPIDPLSLDLKQSSETGVLALDQIDGYSDVYAILEYTDFNFGYISSYSVRNFRPNTVTINDLLVHPIAGHSKIIEKVKEDYTWDYTTYRNSKPNPQAAISGGIMGGAGALAAGVAVGTQAATALAGTFTWGMALGPLGFAIAVLLAAVISFMMSAIGLITFIGYNTAEVYAINDEAYRYIINPYGYESRHLYESNGEQRIKYAGYEYRSAGRIKKSNSSKHFDVLQETKNTFYRELNIDINGFVYPPHEVTIPTPDPPGCKWYKPWCKKQTQASGMGTLDVDAYHKRPLTVHYMGATNTATIVVPYKGDYIVKGYNKQGDMVGSYIATETSFVSSADGGALTMSYAHIKLGLNMNLSPNLIGDACVNDLMVDVGGGVSGAYYELGRTAKYENFFCSKSDNAFVVGNSITHLKVRPLDQENSFTIELTKPMPYVNRVFLATMDMDEDRRYRCFGEYPECVDFKTLDGGDDD